MSPTPWSAQPSILREEFAMVSMGGDDVVALQLDIDAVEVLVTDDRLMLHPRGRQLGVPVDDELMVGCRFRSPPIISGVGGHLPGPADVDG